jgi:hypothetical protein
VESLTTPSQVKIAIALLWGALLIGLAESIPHLFPFEADDAYLDAVMMVVLLVLLIANAALIFFAARQRNWARIALLVLCIAGVATYVVWPPEWDAEPWWTWISTVAATVFEVAAVSMLFLGRGGQWFALRKGT